MQATLTNVVEALNRANCKPTRTGNNYVACCPVHEADGHDHTPSLSVKAGDKVAVIVCCYAGCKSADIFSALGIDTGKSGKAGIGKAGGGKRIVATYTYHDASGAAVFEKVRFEPKDFRIRHRDASGAFVYQIPRSVEPPLYRLPTLLKAIAAGEPVYVVEGEKDADRLATDGLCATTNFDGAAKGSQRPKWRGSYTTALAGADVVLVPDNDEPGRAHMQHIAAALAGTALVRWLELPGLPDKGDVSDWLAYGHTVDELKALAATATAPPDATGTTTPPPDKSGDKAEIERLAALDSLDYDRQRTKSAKALGVRTDTLDKLVKAARGEPENGGGGGGTALEFPDVELWPEPVDGAELLDALTVSVRRFLSLPEHAAPAIALWTAYTYAVINYGHIAPTLAIVSPEKRCGKSTLLTWLYQVVDRPLLAANITAAAIFRTVEASYPTLLIDEADSFLGETGDELRGILNSGHSKKTAKVIRLCGENNEPRVFRTWGAKAVALIGKLEGRYSTLADRSIEVQLRRKLPTERLTKLRHAEPNHFQNLASQCARFALDNGAAIGEAWPDIPESLHDRAADNWEPLFAIADIAGGRWPRLARTAAMALSGGTETGGEGLGVQLLTDLRRHFDEQPATAYTTAELLQYLNDIDDAPWCSFAKGKAMTARHLSRLLRPYGIIPQTIRFHAGLAKGYHTADFADAFARYLPFIRNTGTSQSNSGETPDNVSVTDSACYGYAEPGLASQEAGCYVVTDKTPGTVAAGAAVTDTENPDDSGDWF